MQQHSKSSFRNAVRIAPLCLALLSVGCGGSPGSPTSGGGTAQTSHVGLADITFTGHPNANVTQSSGKVSTVGQAGAVYSSLSVNPAPSLDSTFLLYTRPYGSGQIYSLPAVQSGEQTLLLHSGDSGFPSISQSGVIAFIYNYASAVYLDTVKSDGSGEKVVSSNFPDIPAISPNGATIVGVTAQGNIVTIPSAGGSTTQIYSGGNASQTPWAIWSPAGNQIAFTATNPSTNTLNVYTMTSTGASVTNVTPVADQTGIMGATGWSPDGTALICTYTPVGATTSSLFILSLDGGMNASLTPSTFNDSWGCFSPDGTKIAFYRDTTGGAIPGIYESDFAGGNLQLQFADPTTGSTGAVVGMVWSPFQESQSFVGAHGTLLGTSVSGFLISQNGSQFASLLTFTATTPSSATVTESASNSNGAPMIFTLGADSITNISYTNVYNGTHLSLPLTATPSTIVTIDGTTGFVDYVVPAVAGKAKPMATRSTGTSLTFRGQFSAIYDGSGKNLAPGGATTVEFDRTTGKLTSFQ